MSLKASIAVIDYGTGNLNSVKRALDRVGVRSFTAASPADLDRADKVIMPGVGHFGRAMDHLRSTGLLDALSEAALIRRKPILGICLGMELMAETSDEGNSKGLGWFKAAMLRFRFTDRHRYKVPHMGWNTVALKRNSELMRSIDEEAEFYFAHSYHMRFADVSETLCETEYETTFPSAIERGNIFGVQFHPEKSHDSGLRLLQNFVQI